MIIDSPPGLFDLAEIPKNPTNPDFVTTKVHISGIRTVRDCQEGLGRLSGKMLDKLNAGQDPSECVTEEVQDAISDHTRLARENGTKQCIKYCFAGIVGFCPFSQRRLKPEEFSLLLLGNQLDGGKKGRLGGRIVKTTQEASDMGLVLIRSVLPGGNPLSNMRSTGTGRQAIARIEDHLHNTCSNLDLIPPTQPRLEGIA